MKPFNRFFLSFAFGVVLVMSTATGDGWAGTVSSRDLSADSALSNDGGWGGVLPPTGGPIGSALVAPQAGANVDPFQARTLPSGIELKVIPEDKKAQVYEITGKARISASDTEEWGKLENGAIIEKGNTILTSKKSRVSITLDAALQNVVFIPENTKAVFHSIEPTDIELEDGTIYNIVNKLPDGSYWKVQTPVAVAAVRGTWWFVSYAANDGSYASGIFDDTNTGVDSVVEIIKDDIPLNIPEGFQIQLQEGQDPDPALLQKVDAQWVEEVTGVLAGMTEIQATGNNEGGSNDQGGDDLLGDSGATDSASTGEIGDQLPELDPQDTGSVEPLTASAPPPPPEEEEIVDDGSLCPECD